MTTIWEVDHATPQSVPAVGWRSWSAPWPPASRWRGASTKTGNFGARLDVVKPPQPLGFMSRLWVKHDVPFLLCYTKYLRVISNPVLLSAALEGTFSKLDLKMCCVLYLWCLKYSWFLLNQHFFSFSLHYSSIVFLLDAYFHHNKK